ncbi:MAG: hypothetical protein ABIH26_09230 [Candidatus Eisenbacteria bacterium]
MSRLATRVLSVFVLLILSVSTAGAKEKADPYPLESNVPLPIDRGVTVRPVDCQVGNLNPPYYAIPGFILPPEEYKLVFDPNETCTACPDGVIITTVHVLLQTAELCTLVMAVDVEEAVYPNDPDCPEPGPELCNSGLYSVTIPQAGLWNIGLPISCPCMGMDDLYLLSFHIEDVGPETYGTMPDLVTDNSPAACTSWNNYGNGWDDLYEVYGFPGQLSFYADATCCEATGTEESSWGSIKKRYRK